MPLHWFSRCQSVKYFKSSLFSRPRTSSDLLDIKVEVIEPHPKMMMARINGDEFLMFPVWISNYEETNKVTINNVFLHREKLYKLYPYSSHKTLRRSYLNLVTENTPKEKAHTCYETLLLSFKTKSVMNLWLCGCLCWVCTRRQWSGTGWGGSEKCLSLAAGPLSMKKL